MGGPLSPWCIWCFLHQGCWSCALMLMLVVLILVLLLMHFPSCHNHYTRGWQFQPGRQHPLASTPTSFAISAPYNVLICLVDSHVLVLGTKSCFCENDVVVGVSSVVAGWASNRWVLGLILSVGWDTLWHMLDSCSDGHSPHCCVQGWIQDLKRGCGFREWTDLETSKAKYKCTVFLWQKGRACALMPPKSAHGDIKQSCDATNFTYSMCYTAANITSTVKFCGVTQYLLWF